VNGCVVKVRPWIETSKYVHGGSLGLNQGKGWTGSSGNKGVGFERFTGSEAGLVPVETLASPFRPLVGILDGGSRLAPTPRFPVELVRRLFPARS
jgi:hypothetical protein